MRFEKINENKLKIELTKEDLVEHNIKISDIAFGADNSRKLLHEIMTQAFDELGFEADNLPLVIEAVPTSGYSINIFITKIKDEAELEENLGKVAKQKEKNLEGLNLLEKFTNEFEAVRDKLKESESDHKEKAKESFKDTNNDNSKGKNSLQKSILEKTEIIYKFETLDDVIEVSQALNGYTGKSCLYKHSEVYYLFLNAKGFSKSDIVRLRLTLDEFGDFVSTHKVAKGFLNEHGTIILKSDVVKKLGKIE